MAYPTVDANKNQMIYNSPSWTVSGSDVVQGNKSSIGDQIVLDVYIKRALEDAAKEQYFTQLSSTYNMPKNMGKTIKKNYYIPLLDDRNVNEQGIDSTGAAKGANNAKGNLYGSSKDITKMTAGMPRLTEIGGRVNRVGFTRVIRESSIHKLGFFYEFTQEALDFDSDAELLSHMGREAILGANELTEDMLGMELITGAGVQVFTGSATGLASMSAESGVTASVVTYKDLQKLAITLKENRAPNKLQAITGSRIIDTKIVGSGYALYVGLPMEIQIRNLVDQFNNPAFIPVEKYAQGGNTLRGEIGAVGQFRIIVVPEMPEQRGVGVTATGTGLTTYRTTGSKYDAYPMLAVASEAFTTIGFQTGNMGAKFQMVTKLPGTITADRTDPYGESGFTSIKWYHGMMIDRPEWIAVMYSLAAI